MTLSREQFHSFSFPTGVFLVISSSALEIFTPFFIVATPAEIIPFLKLLRMLSADITNHDFFRHFCYLSRLPNINLIGAGR